METVASKIKPMSEESKRLGKLIRESNRRHYAAKAKRWGRKTFAETSKQYGGDVIPK